MAKPKKTISTSYIRPLLDDFEHFNIDRAKALDAAQLPYDLDQRAITLEQYQLLLTYVLAHVHDNDLAARLISQTEMTRHDLLGLLVMCGLTLRNAIKAAMRFYRLQIKFIRLSYREEDDFGIIRIEPDGVSGIAEAFTLKMTMLALLKAKEDLIGASIEKDLVRLSCPEIKTDSLNTSFQHTELSFNQPFYELAIPIDTLNTKLKSANQITFEMLQKQCEHTLAQQTPDQPIDTKVSLLLHDIKDTFPDLSQMASLLAMSPRTLSRQLSHLNASYQTLLDKEKIVRSKELLLYTKMSITDIATQLYFSDSSYFSKVFKKHMTMSPKQYRLENQQSTH